MSAHPQLTTPPTQAKRALTVPYLVWFSAPLALTFLMMSGAAPLVSNGITWMHGAEGERIHLSAFLMTFVTALFIYSPMFTARNVAIRTVADRRSMRTFTLFYAVGSLISGTLLILVLSVAFGVLPNSGDYVSITVDPLRNLSQFIFPAITLGFGFTSSVMRTTRSAMLEVLRQDYVRTARGKGVREREVITIHSLRNALIPIITIVGVEFGYLLGGAVIVENVFSLPGIGRLILNGIYQRDYAVVQGGILFVAVNFVLINLAVDIIYAFADPRIRYE